MSAPPPPAWAVTHAALPATATTCNSGMHLYYSARDGDGRSHIGRAGVNLDGDDVYVDVHDEHPVLSPGNLGSFDDAGVTISCVVQDGDLWKLYYTGWTLGVSVPFYLSVGIAVSDDGGRTFGRVSAGPLLDRNGVDPYMTASPFVLCEEGVWRMWYVSCVRWALENGAPRHYYHLRYADSDDGLHWRRTGLVALDFADEREYAFGRPCVVRDMDRYRMWYCVRGTGYRLGYAESDDGLVWARRDGDVDMRPSPDGWDAQMMAYPYVLQSGGSLHMLYNGNDYGATGIGYATAPA